MKTRIFGLVSDTHGFLHPALIGAFEGVEAILHAGDVCGQHIMDELNAIAPLHAVRGNCDEPHPDLPAVRMVELPGGTALITHGHLIDNGATNPEIFVKTYAANKPDLILFGHSHQWFCELIGSTWVVNPGSAGRPRFSSLPSAALLHCSEDGWRIERLDLPWPPREAFR